MPRLGLGATSQRFVQVATDSGYTVVAVGPNRFRVARVYRPKWAKRLALVTAVFAGLGLLFLLVKRTETGDAVIAEDRSGVRMRLVGGLQPQFVAALRVVMGAPPNNEQPPPAERGAARPLEARQPVLPWVAQPPGALAAVLDSRLIESSPTMPANMDATVRHSSRTSPVTSGALLMFADGRAIPADNGGVIGRDPSADPQMVGAARHPIADPSLSKTHFSFGPLPHGVWIVDHHSTNGTTVVTDGVVAACVPGVRTEAPFGAKVIAGDVSIVVGVR